MYSSDENTAERVELTLTYDDEILLGTIMLNSQLDALLDFAQELSLVPDMLERTSAA